MKNKKVIITIMLVLLVASIGLAAYAWLSKDDDNSYTDTDGITYQEATEAEKQESENIKKENSEQIDNSQGAPTSNESGQKKTVTPIITAWSQDSSGDLRINGYVPEVTEEDGTCSYTLTNGNMEVEQSRSALLNAQSTSCGQIVISSNKLSPGQWKITLTYSSSNSKGTSDETTIQIN